MPHPSPCPDPPHRGPLELLLLRHAKSDWSVPVPDHDRPLSPRGRRAARAMGQHLAGRQPRVELVLCSTARRARETVELALQGWSPPPPVVLLDELYLASAQDILEQVRGVDQRLRCVLVCGHNPALHDMATLLAGRGDPHELAELAERLPTGSLVSIELAGGWGEVAFAAGRLVGLLTPRGLQAG